MKTAYLLADSAPCKNECESVSQFFHILDSVAVVNGSIKLDKDVPYFTRYSCCINTDKNIYYYKTYFNNQISAVSMNNNDILSDSLFEFPLVGSQQINYIC